MTLARFRAVRMPQAERSTPRPYPCDPHVEHDLDTARGIVNGLAISAVLWLLLFGSCRALFGQVAPVVTIVHGEATTQVGNPGRAAQTVTLGLWRSLTDSGAPAVLVSPGSVVLDPGTLQTVRLRTREACSPAWRWVVVFTPVTVTPRLAAGSVSLTLVTRIIGKVACT